MAAPEDLAEIAFVSCNVDRIAQLTEFLFDFVVGETALTQFLQGLAGFLRAVVYQEESRRLVYMSMIPAAFACGNIPLESAIRGKKRDLE